MKRLFFAFPDGCPGVVLLLLRAVLGLVVVVQGALCIGEQNATSAAWFVGLSALACGGLLLIGLLTPIVGAIVAVGILSVVISLLPACVPSLFNSRISVLFALTMLLTVIGIGPGAFSLDARFFGRREIIIPRRISQSQE